MSNDDEWVDAPDEATAPDNGPTDLGTIHPINMEPQQQQAAPPSDDHEWVDAPDETPAVHSQLEDLITGEKPQQKEIPSLFQHPIDALTSKDWWTTDDNGVQRSPMQSVAGAPMAALDALTFGSGDELVGGVNAGIDALQGHNYNDAYDQRLAQARDIESNTPTATKIITALAAARNIPLPSSIPKGASLLRKGISLAGEGAGLGGAYGFGSGEGGFGERLKSAGSGAEFGSVLSPLASALAATPGTVGRFLGLGGQSAEKIAGNKLNDMAGDAIKSIANNTDDPFYKTRTLAEQTQSPMLAALEQDLTKKSPELSARLLANNKARAVIQKQQMQGLSGAAPLERDEAGNALRDIINPHADAAKKEASDLFESIDPNAEVPLKDLRSSATALAKKSYLAGGMPSSVKGLIQELNDTVKTGTMADGTEIRMKPETKPYEYMKALRERAQQAWVDAKNSGQKDEAKVTSHIWHGVDDAVDKAAESGSMTKEDVAKYREAKKKFSEYSKKFTEGPVGRARQDRTTPSSVINTVFNGKAENTRALLDAIPNDPEKMDAVRGMIRDKIVRENLNNDQNLSPGKLRTFLRENREGLTAQTKDGKSLFTPEHLDTLDKVATDMAHMDPSSELSTRGMAYAASKGQPTTAQTLMQHASSIAASAIKKIVPYSDWISNGAEMVNEHKAAKVNEILGHAAFDKEYAKLLASKATPASVEKAQNILSSLGNKAVLLRGVVSANQSQRGQPQDKKSLSPLPQALRRSVEKSLSKSNQSAYPYSPTNSNLGSNSIPTAGTSRDFVVDSGIGKKRTLALVEALKNANHPDLQKALQLADAGGVGVYDDGK